MDSDESPDQLDLPLPALASEELLILPIVRVDPTRPAVTLGVKLLDLGDKDEPED